MTQTDPKQPLTKEEAAEEYAHTIHKSNYGIAYLIPRQAFLAGCAYGEQAVKEETARVFSMFKAEMKSCPPEFMALVDKHFWELLA